jgi:hypothetical protein
MLSQTAHSSQAVPLQALPVILTIPRFLDRSNSRAREGQETSEISFKIAMICSSVYRLQRAIMGAMVTRAGTPVVITVEAT